MLFRMKVVKGKPQGHCLSFPVGEFMFGRGPECDVRPNSDLVSRQHCLLEVSVDSALVRDLGSRNGTLVNGELVRGERKLTHGDSLQIGPLVLQFIVEEAVDVASVSIADTALMNQENTVTNKTVAPDTREQPVPVPETVCQG